MKYKIGVIVGRFQGLHKGHEKVINEALATCERVLILVGSAQESGTKRNPFPLRLRLAVLNACFSRPNVLFMGCNDLTNKNDWSEAWGDYIVNIVRMVYGENPEVIFVGEEEGVKYLFSTCHLDIVKVKRNKAAEISGTKIREMLVNNDKEQWEKNTPEKEHPFYDELRIYVKLAEIEKATRVAEKEWSLMIDKEAFDKAKREAEEAEKFFAEQEQFLNHLHASRGHRREIDIID